MVQGNARQRYSWKVTYRRADWGRNTQDAARRFESHPAARRFVNKLLADDRPDLSPLEFVRIDRRPVGPWEQVSAKWVDRAVLHRLRGAV